MAAGTISMEHTVSISNIRPGTHTVRVLREVKRKDRMEYWHME